MVEDLAALKARPHQHAASRPLCVGSRRPQLRWRALHLQQAEGQPHSHRGHPHPRRFPDRRLGRAADRRHVGAYTKTWGAGRHTAETRLLALYYQDWHHILKTDSRPAAVRATDFGNIRIATFGGHHLSAVTTSAGTADFLFWGVAQTGKWGVLDHRASGSLVSRRRGLPAVDFWLHGAQRRRSKLPCQPLGRRRGVPRAPGRHPGRVSWLRSWKIRYPHDLSCRRRWAHGLFGTDVPALTMLLPRTSRGSLILVGGHSRGVGKTSVVQTILRTVTTDSDRWTAIKISRHRHTTPAPDLTTGTPRNAGTDRYLAAGASRALLFRAPDNGLADAAHYIERLLATGENVIAESNRLILHCAPDLTIFVVDPANPDWKESSAVCLEKADAIVLTGVTGATGRDLHNCFPIDRVTWSSGAFLHWLRANTSVSGRSAAIPELGDREPEVPVPCRSRTAP